VDLAESLLEQAAGHLGEPEVGPGKHREHDRAEQHIRQPTIPEIAGYLGRTEEETIEDLEASHVYQATSLSARRRGRHPPLPTESSLSGADAAVCWPAPGVAEVRQNVRQEDMAMAETQHRDGAGPPVEQEPAAPGQTRAEMLAVPPAGMPDEFAQGRDPAADGEQGLSAGAGQEPPTTRQVLDDHLRCRQAGDLEADILHNYHPGVRLLSAEGVHHGHDGVRRLASILRSYLQDGDYHYGQILVDGEVGMLTWSGRCARTDTAVHDGADSYVIRDGSIVAQTIHYSTTPLDGQPD
jgi:hypothetical protein